MLVVMAKAIKLQRFTNPKDLTTSSIYLELLRNKIIVF